MEYGRCFGAITKPTPVTIVVLCTATSSYVLIGMAQFQKNYSVGIAYNISLAHLQKRKKQENAQVWTEMGEEETNGDC